MPPLKSPPVADLAAIRRRLEGGAGPARWRSLEEAASSAPLEPFARAGSPAEMAAARGLSRRELLQWAAASLALAGLAACRKPLERIYPYDAAPEEVVPGRPLHFATGLPHRGYARGALVESNTGRPTKVEGNPKHPDSLGATDIFMQAAVLDLYDPDRSQAVLRRGSIATWPDALAALRGALAEQFPRRGEGLRVLTETVTSPTLAALLSRLRESYPRARWHQYEPAGRDQAREGARLAFGRALDTHYRLAEADVIVSLDADFLVTPPGGLRYSLDFGRRRKPQGPMNRLYVLESTPSKTGAKADHRLPLPDADVGAFAAWLAREAGANVLGFAPLPPSVPERWARALAKDLAAHRGRGAVLAGDCQPAAVHALAHAANAALGNGGRAVVYTAPVEAEPVDHMASLRSLTEAMAAGEVQALLILGGNPVYNAPADLAFAAALGRVPTAFHLARYVDETSAACQWHLPESHALEQWGDLLAFDGSATIQQPLIAPLYGGQSAAELVAALLSATPQPAQERVRDLWRARWGAGDFDRRWEKSLSDGIVADTAFPSVTPRLAGAIAAAAAPPRALELILRPDPSIDDGRPANNAWLQELPKPLTRLAWDNAALVSPALAEREGLSNGDVVSLEVAGRSALAPVWILPGQASETVTAHLGYGRSRSGRVGTGLGFNAYSLRSSTSPWGESGLRLRKTGEQRMLASVQNQQAMQGRGLLQSGTLAEYRAHPDFAKNPRAPGPSDTLYSPRKRGDYSWGMAIDLSSCIGCNACVVACQAENNIPVVGKDEVARGRAMHWIRVDAYYGGGLDRPSLDFQPVPCMHCEDAPCEVVCPVGATVHDDEGLNEMVYNRCIGTRYCSNNCPYKVRRFNFLWYSDYDTPAMKLLYNPEVTVRARGVMEKCTYCVQRIKRAEIQAEVDGRRLRDGEVVTACQAACPAEAIVFGDVADPRSKVSRLKAEARNYALLDELGTRPRTTYLARITDPNPESA